MYCGYEQVSIYDKLLFLTHCVDFILGTVSYIWIILSHTGKLINNAHFPVQMSRHPIRNVMEEFLKVVIPGIMGWADAGLKLIKATNRLYISMPSWLICLFLFYMDLWCCAKPFNSKKDLITLFFDASR